MLEIIDSIMMTLWAVGISFCFVLIVISYFFSPHKRDKLNAFNFYLANVSTFIFLLWILFLIVTGNETMGLGKLVYFMTAVGILLIFIGYLYFYKYGDLVFLDPKKRKTMLLTSILGFAVFLLGLTGIVASETSHYSLFMSLMFGISLGFLGAYIAYQQMLLKWKRWGFALAKSIEEKSIVKEFNRKQLPETYRLSKKYYFLGSYGFVLGLFIMGEFIFGQFFEEQLELFIMGSIGALFLSFITCYIVLCFYADKKIRLEKISRFQGK